MLTDKKITAAAVVSTPTPDCWSQAYIAGSFFAAISLAQQDTIQEGANDSLIIAGKEIINTLEAEYFTLETKNLSSIQIAIEIAIKQVLEKESLSLSAGFASIVDNVLYVFALGGAKVYMNRDKKLGLLLSSDNTKIIVSASGFLEDNDVVIVQTTQFNKAISTTAIKNAAVHNTPAEIAENLSAIVQDEQNSGASAVVFSFKNKETQELQGTPVRNASQSDAGGKESKETEEAHSAGSGQAKETEVPEAKPQFPHILPAAMASVGKIAFWINHLPSKLVPLQALDRKRKMFLTITIILACMLAGSAFFVLQKTQQAKNEALFEKVYTDAKKKYDEGQSLASLNKNLARDDLVAAQKILLENKNAFENDKPHQEKMNALLKNVEDAIAVVSGVNKVDAKEVGKDQNLFLTTVISNNPLAASQDDKSIYGISQTVIFRVDKKTEKKTDIIANKNSWENAFGIGSFLNNIYVLDKSGGQIYKFVPSGSSFSKSNYLVGNTQDFSKTSGMAIDGSIWILSKDGAIQKWTRGKTDAFTVSGLDEPFSNPTRIFTDADINNVYILDNGNSRVVVLAKNGDYKTQYQNTTLKNAKEFDVLEKDKKIFVLSNGKIWQIDL